MRLHKTQTPEQSRLKMLLWAALASLIFGLIGFGEIAEDWLRVGRNSFHKHAASGDIVLVAIDDESLRQVGRWPWPRRYHADLIDKLTKAGANRIFLDVILENSSSPTDDRRLAKSIADSGKVVLAVRDRSGLAKGANSQSQVEKQFSAHADLAVISVVYNYQNAVWTLPYRGDRNQSVPSFSSKLAGAPPSVGDFRLDYSLDPTTIPVVSAGKVLSGAYSPKSIAGKDVVIGTASDAIGDQYFLPGFGKMGGAYVHILGAETLKSGRPWSAGWLPALILTLLAGYIAVTRSRRSVGYLVLIAVTVGLLALTTIAESWLIFFDITPALFLLAWIASATALKEFRTSGRTNPVSGLPNLNALRLDRKGRDCALIVAKVLNYSEIAAALPQEQERKLIDQIVSRLSVGTSDRVLYHGDGGVFAWFEDSSSPFGNHVEALYSLFRNPARAGDLSIDLTVSFGVEIGSSRSISNRLARALVATDEAARDGLKWKFYDPEALQNAAWKLSMLSQLDSAVDKGEVWVAFQPKLDLATRRIVGAEALARWTHPEKGPIAASEFISAAEQHDRIGKLTDYVLEQAIKAAATLARRQPAFGMAVNLSAKLLADQGFTLRLAAMLARHQLPAEHLTLELTETAELAGSGQAIDMLASLCELGVTISIDDYGTGLSTLDYLKKIPAKEIKIDQSFVKGMLDNRSDLVMVQSTIALAHSLGRKVVAEGVEQQSVLDLLIDMKCDVAQGYIVGRPMSLDSLIRRLPARKNSRVA